VNETSGGQEPDSPRRATPEELRGLALWRHYEAARERAATLVALSRYRATDREPLYVLHTRQHHQLIDALHDFCYHARKTLELAEQHRPGILERANNMRLLRNGGELDLGIDGPVVLADRTLLWMLGRVIHSQDVGICAREEIDIGSPWAAAPKTTSYWPMVAVGVRSDFDEPNDYHYVSIEQLVEAFCRLDDSIHEALDAARRY
jgi:hypothetical protein